MRAGKRWTHGPSPKSPTYLDRAEAVATGATFTCRRDISRYQLPS